MISTKGHSLVHISVYFKKTKFSLLKSVYFHYKVPTKQISIFFPNRVEEKFNVSKVNWLKSKSIDWFLYEDNTGI